ncbi:TetR/AcrR family transcriptional regulator [Inquilinus sp. YAF38]|uniref:TetR/AcrR family transcriptional regulator n=1 Tax=Inquilinus sp. YAF38 TaxID=3233084 RepID=UPI003F91DC6C
MAILTHAAQLFLEHGYELVSVDSIVARVGGSKTNIYRHFGGKEGLLNAVVEHESAILRRQLDELRLDGLPIPRALEKIGEAFLSVIYDPQAVALHRLVIAQGRRFPEIATTFSTNGPEGAVKAVVGFIESRQALGDLDASRDAHLLAHQYLGLLRLDAHARVLLGLDAVPSKADRPRIVAEAVRTFLTGAGP